MGESSGLNFDKIEQSGEAVLAKENIENKLKRHYLFTNNDISDHPVIFDCYAETDEDAEGQYKNKMGKGRDNSYVGISIVLEKTNVSNPQESTN